MSRTSPPAQTGKERWDQKWWGKSRGITDDFCPNLCSLEKVVILFRPEGKPGGKQVERKTIEACCARRRRGDDFCSSDNFF